MRFRHALGYPIRLFYRSLHFLFPKTDLEPPYLTLFGFTCMADGWGKVAIGIAQALHPNISIGFSPTRGRNLKTDLPTEVKSLISKKSKLLGKVILYTDCTWPSQKQPLLDKISKNKLSEDQIRLAYSMFESNKIPSFWRSILHQYFDAVIVPDPSLIEVYQNSGVVRPIFSIPLSVDYQHFLSKPLKTKKNSPFVFADFGVFVPRKNHLTLIQAFAKAFGNNRNIILKLNGRYAQGKWHETIAKEVARLGLNQVILTKKCLTQNEYIEEFQTVDCYINLSKGEGFSIPVREAMAQGIPVICADNTALSTICKTGLVRSVKATQKEPAYYHWVEKGYYGHFFNCTVDDAAVALLDMYENYEKYLSLAPFARKWASTQDCQSLQPLYQTLVKPPIVTLGTENLITHNELITSSKELYQKFK